MNLLNRVLDELLTWPGRAKPLAADTYVRLYENHANAATDEQFAIGAGDFDHVGQNELSILIAEGLKPGHTLVDFGCGVGRLATHAIPYLVGGRYVGIDVSKTFLAHAKRRCPRGLHRGCRVEWVRQTTTEFPRPAASVDALCAYSVFTHLEHEDSYRYLLDARRVVKPGGFLVFSCLPVDLTASRELFIEEAKMDFAERWARVRIVMTSVGLMTAIAELAGWTVRRWRAGGEKNVPGPGGQLVAFGHSTCVLERPRD